MSLLTIILSSTLHIIIMIVLLFAIINVIHTLEQPTVFGPFYVPILTADNEEYFHAKNNINNAVGMAVEKVREYHNIELLPRYLNSNCDASKAINKIAAVLEKAKKTEEKIDDPVAFVGFACDAGLVYKCDSLV